jgi:alpha-D-ribose 1-methylphosphonate 5-triphosphate synthase subunit PhnG
MRRLLARLLVLLVLAGGLVPLTAGASWACSCVPTTTTEEERWRSIASSAPVVYVAEVADSREVQTPEGSPEREYTLRVVNSLKGGAMGTRTVRTGIHEAICGVKLDPTRRVLVHGDRLGYCTDSGTQKRVPERAAIVEAALHREPTSYAATAGESVGSIAARQLREQLGTAPTREHAAYAERLLHKANRKVLGPRPGPVQPGTRLLVPRLT